MDGRIVGFATVSAASIHVDDISEKLRRRLPHYPLPVLRLARLAVDQGWRQRGVGRQLLRTILLLAHEMADRVGCIGVLVDAKPDAVEYYRQYGSRNWRSSKASRRSSPANTHVSAAGGRSRSGKGRAGKRGVNSWAYAPLAPGRTRLFFAATACAALVAGEVTEGRGMRGNGYRVLSCQTQNSCY